MLFYLFGHLRDFVRQRLERSKKARTPTLLLTLHAHQRPAEWLLHADQNVRVVSQNQGYARVRQDYEDFFTRRFYYRMHVRKFSPLT